MKNKKAIELLLKIAENQQKIIEKIAQLSVSDEDLLPQLSDFIKTQAAAWVINNAGLKYKYSVETDDSEVVDFIIHFKLAHVSAAKPIDFATPANLQAYLVERLNQHPVFKNKTFKFDIKVVPNL